MRTVETDRLLLRPPMEPDRRRFVDLFTDEAFMVFADDAHDTESANARFDRMLAFAEVVPYAKQPVIERASGTIVGYTGVDTAVVGAGPPGRPRRLLPPVRLGSRSAVRAQVR